MKAYRVEDQRRGHGIWRDFDGKVNPVFSKLTQGKCKDMPMEDSEFYRCDGKQWFSATDTPEKLKAWFSALDVVEMLDLGYSVFEFEISSCRVVSEYEICFTRDCIISQKEIDPRDIYGAEYEKALKTMSGKKQIEEMARVLNEEGKSLDTIYPEDCEKIARIFYYEGYRKMPENIGEFSDGYHTFNELYHHRAVLFSVICNMFPDKAWKAKKHDTGDMYDGMFIVGIETEQGQATYHYDIDPYWNMFKVKELEKAPKYDGHTPSDAIARIGNLSCAGYRKQSEGEWKPSDIPQEKYVCSVCGGACWYYDYQGDVAKSRYCPNCGAKMKDGAE